MASVLPSHAAHTAVPVSAQTSEGQGKSHRDTEREKEEKKRETETEKELGRETHRDMLEVPTY